MRACSRLVERRDQCVAVDFGNLLEQVRFEVPADHCRGPQHVQRLRRDALQPALQHDPHGVGDLHVVEVEVARPVIARVEQSALFLQVPEQLGDEERIPAGVIGELPHEPGRRVGRPSAASTRLHFGWPNGRSAIVRA